jgi:hypothetical protein
MRDQAALAKRREALRGDASMLKGSQATEVQGIKRCNQELAAPELQGIDDRYR